jgi:hypothetical protein
MRVADRCAGVVRVQAGLVLPSIFSSVPKPPPAPRPPNDMGPIVDGVWMSPEAELHSYDIKHLVRFFFFFFVICF